MVKVSIPPITMTSKEVKFTVVRTKTKTVEVAKNVKNMKINLVLKRSDTGKTKKFCAVIGNVTDDKIESIELVPRDSVEQMWNHPHFKYKDPSKQGGFSRDIFVEGELSMR